jgi:SWIM zinc finger
MSLAFKLGSQFDRRLQERGRHLVDTGAVRVTDRGPDHIHAIVSEVQDFDVRVTYLRDARNRDNLLVSCTCPYFDDYSRCKHIWAVILEASHDRSLPNAEYARFLRIDREPPAVDAPAAAAQPRVYEMPRRERTPAWKEYLTQIQANVELRKADPEWAEGFELLYSIDPLSSRTTGAVVVDLYSRSRKKNGEPTVWKDFRISHTRAGQLPDPVDADLVPMLLCGTDTFSFNYSASYGTSTRKALPHALALKVLPRAADAGRLALRGEHQQQFIPLTWDEGEPWRLLLEIRQDDRDQWAITGSLARGEERMALTEPALLLRGGFVAARGHIARLEDEGAFGWIEQLLAIRQIPFPDRERDAVLASLLNTKYLPKLELDEPLRFEERHAAPRFALRIT